MGVVEANYGSVEVKENGLGEKPGEKDRVDKSVRHRQDTFTKRPVFVVLNCPPHTKGAIILVFSSVFFSSTKSTALAVRGRAA